MNNNTIFYLILTIILWVLGVSFYQIIFWEPTPNQKKDIEKQIMIESQLPTIEFDPSNLQKITTIKNIKTN